MCPIIGHIRVLLLDTWVYIAIFVSEWYPRGDLWGLRPRNGHLLPINTCIIHISIRDEYFQ